jgi:hypothetical protein
MSAVCSNPRRMSRFSGWGATVDTAFLAIVIVGVLIAIFLG